MQLTFYVSLSLSLSLLVETSEKRQSFMNHSCMLNQTVGKQDKTTGTTIIRSPQYKIGTTIMEKRVSYNKMNVLNKRQPPPQEFAPKKVLKTTIIATGHEMDAQLLLFLPKPKISCHLSNQPNRAFARQIIRRWKKQQQQQQVQGVFDKKANLNLSKSDMVGLSEEVLIHLNSKSEVGLGGFLDSNSLYSLMLYLAENGLFPQAQAMWDQLLNSSSLPTIQTVAKLFDILSHSGHFARVSQILSQLSSRDVDILPQAYSLAVSCFGNAGQLELMESVVRDMLSKGLSVDSQTANVFVRYYSLHGSLTEMEAACDRLKRSGYLLDNEGIRAVSLAYLKQKKLHRLGEFAREAGLGRKDVGNLLWNMLLLSYAANFKMKSLQREFLRMVGSGFRPDLTTFNVRAMAFSRMSLMWDLHLSLEHMRHEMVAPDLVTYSCVVDAYLDKRLGRNLDFALKTMNLDDSPVLLTDPLVFEVLGKGDFHLNSEAFLEFSSHRNWTYRKLIAVYKKKQYRRNQIFWNY